MGKYSKRNYKHYDVDGHIDEKCWKHYLEFNLKWYKSKKGMVETTKVKETNAERTFDVDEDIFCIGLQQPRESGDKIHYSKSKFK